MAKYKIEIMKESKNCLTTILFFDNAKELKDCIKGIEKEVNFYCCYAKYKQEFLKREDGVYKYSDFIKCPVILQGFK